LEIDPNLAPEVSAAQREMLVVLKLQQKLSAPPASGPRPRVTTFNREQGRQVVTSGGKPVAPASLDELERRLTDRNAQSIATRDVEGGLLLNSDTERIDELLHPPGQPQFFARQGERHVLVRQLDSGTRLQGWLEPDATNPTRTLAKFELVQSRPSARSQTLPTMQEARRTRVQELPR
jgi:hypothetical protein